MTNEQKNAKVDAAKVDEKTNQAFVLLCQPTIDKAKLLTLPEKCWRDALTAINAFKADAEKKALDEKNKVCVLDKMLTDYGIIENLPSMDEVRAFTHSQSTSTNSKYYQYMLKPNGATLEDLERVRVAESKRTGVELGGCLDLVSNMKRTLLKHNVTIITMPNGNLKLMRIAEVKK